MLILNELIRLAEKRGWVTNDVGTDDEVDMQLYPKGSKVGDVFYTVYEYPEEYIVMRSKFTNGGRDISDVVIGSCATQSSVMSVIEEDYKRVRVK